MSGLFPSFLKEGWREAPGWSDFFENQIPDAVAELEAAALEFGFRSGVRPVGVTGRRVPKLRLGGEHLEHLPGVFLPIGAGMHAGAGLHPRGEQRGERRLDQAPLVMALLRPGVGKEYVHAG